MTDQWPAEAIALAEKHGLTLPEIPQPVDPQLEAFREWVRCALEDNSHSYSAAFDAGAAYVRGLPQETFDEASQYGWLVEEDYGHGCHWIALMVDSWPRWKTSTRRSRRDSDFDLESIEYLSPVRRVKDANEALRFARKEDAEAFIALFDRWLLQAKATEHAWDGFQLARGEVGK